MLSASFRRRLGLATLLTLSLGALGASSAYAGPGDYIVLYDSSAALSQGLKTEQSRGNQPEEIFRSAVKGFVAPLDSGDVKRLRAQDGVLTVEADRKVSIQGTRSTTLWGLDRLDQRALSPRDNSITTTGDGSGVSAYIIDTGIRRTHSQLSGRVRAGYDAIGDGQNSNDCNGHGTHVAGTTAGSTYGVAPAANLVAVRVLDCTGSGYNSGVVAGIDWMVADHASGPAVANMSLGSGYSGSVNAAVQRAVDDGITMAVAAGNDNANACGYSPASATNAITVGASTSTDSRAYFSNFGSCVDIFAPGMSITSAWYTSDTATASLSGTSMATPHVAGAAALLLSQNPAWTPAQVRSSMVSNATQGVLTDPGTNSPNLLLYVGDPSSPSPDPPPPPPAPANNNFADAATISSLTSNTGTNSNATRETGEPTHVYSSSGSGASIWYKWTAPADGTLDLSTQGSSFDTLLAVYTGSSVSSLTSKAGDDDSPGGLWSELSLEVQSGVTYRIAVDGYNSASGQTALSGSFTAAPPPPPPPPAPANDNFADAIALSALSGQTGYTVSATHETGEPQHVSVEAGPAHSIWYTWTADDSGTLELSTQGSAFDTLLAVYVGDSLSTLSPKAANHESFPGSGWSRVRLEVSPGVTYRIAVDGYQGASGEVTLSGSFTPTPDPEPEPDPDPPAPVLDTIITAGPGSSTIDTRPTFSFRSSEEAAFECSLDGSAFTDCDSPYQPASDLTVGAHSFSVRAVNADGVPDPTPASLAFVVQSTSSDNPPTLPAIFIPADTTLTVRSRIATLSLACVPWSTQVNSTDCVGRLRLITPQGSSVRSVTMSPSSSRNLSFVISRSLSRRISSGKTVKAKLRIYQGSASRDVPVTLRRAARTAGR